MNFFRSVFHDDPDPEESDSDALKSEEEQETLGSDSSLKESCQTSTPSMGGWSFGGLMQTLATKSESVIEIYRRDLQEFGSGLKKEIEGAHGSLETVGQAIDEIGSSVLKSTAQIISQGRDAVLAAEQDSDSSDTNSSKSYSVRRGLNRQGYSRFDAQVRLIQGDINTFCEEPDDLNDYSKWKSGFNLEEMRNESERLLMENHSMKNIYERVVPGNIDRETFWSRYFYKVHKLKQADHMRANLVKRAISREDEEELSWDVDDDDDVVEEVANATEKTSEMKLKGYDGSGTNDTLTTVSATKGESSSNVNELDTVELQGQKDSSEKENLGAKDSEKVVKKETLVEESRDGTSDAAAKGVEVSETLDNVESATTEEPSEPKPDKKASLEANAASGESSGEFSVVSTQAPMQEEEDLGWDEIEDLSTIDDKKVTHGISSPKRAELRKRLSTAEEEEDLSWDIEEDDEPIKA